MEVQSESIAATLGELASAMPSSIEEVLELPKKVTLIFLVKNSVFFWLTFMLNIIQNP